MVGQAIEQSAGEPLDGRHFMSLVTVEGGSIRLVTVSRPAEGKTARGLIMTLSNPSGIQFTPGERTNRGSPRANIGGLTFWLILAPGYRGNRAASTVVMAGERLRNPVTHFGS